MIDQLLKVEGYCRMQGDSFSPSAIEAKTRIIFDRKNEPGEIGKIGRYKGNPIPYGNAEIVFSETGSSADLFSSEASILNSLEEHLASFRASGVEEISLNVNVFYEEQCNLELSPELLKRLYELGVALNISCQQI